MRVHEQVDDDLVQPGAAATQRRQRLELGGEPHTLLACVALNHVHRRFDPRVQVDLVPFAFVDPGEEPQVFDDPLDPAQAFAGSLDQPRHVVERVIEVELLGDRVDLAVSARRARRRSGGASCLVEADQRDDVAQVALEHGDVVADEGQRVVDLMSHARHELAQARELLGLDHPALRGLERLVSLAFGSLALVENDILFLELFLGAHPLGDVPEDSLNADRLAVRPEKGRLHDLDVELLTPGRDVLFDDVEDLPALEDFLVVAAILFGQLGWGRNRSRSSP